ncbi:MAG TPA: hypothetical protein VK668_22020 [Mucilaginibacter sp.]|nr:hypothetical protein [Mucilaginibacter sp.]
MKPVSLLFLFIIFTHSLKAQENEAARQFIREVIKVKHVVYVDSAGDAGDEMRKILDRDTIHTLMQDDSTFVITKKERAHINKELNTMRSFAWKAGLLDSSILISEDTLKKVFSKKNGSPSANWKYFHTHYGDGYYYFSKPIFLRNNTICIFRFGYWCDWTLCGHGHLAIYEKKGGKWVAWYPLKAWQL